ncbi:MAG: sigma-70 family RNA polymerase sigma factor [Anaerolineae bacterium]
MTTLRNLSGHPGEIIVGAETRPDTTALVIELFEQYQAAIFAYLYRLAGDREWAHDLTQETFLRLFRTRRQLARVENRRAWLYRIATNLAFNFLKRQRRFAWLPWRQGDSLRTAGPDVTEQSDQRLAVEHALGQLPPQYRAPLLLYSHYGFKVVEIAQMLNISPGAVKTRLYRAREMFRQAYQGGDGV